MNCVAYSTKKNTPMSPQYVKYVVFLTYYMQDKFQRRVPIFRHYNLNFPIRVKRGLLLWCN